MNKRLLRIITGGGIVLIIGVGIIGFLVFQDKEVSSFQTEVVTQNKVVQQKEEETAPVPEVQAPKQSLQVSQGQPAFQPPPLKIEQDANEPPLKLKSIGVNLDYYDSATNRAGDFVFTKSALSFGLLFFDYGYVIPAGMSASGMAKANPQPTFILPMGTKVRSLVDGVVVATPILYSGDYSIQVATSAQSPWRYETEHVSNPLVKVGDRVVAGQVIAEVSPHDSTHNSGFGLVEIGILKGGGAGPPEHMCPFAYLDPSVKEEIERKIMALYTSWEEYIENVNLYDESALVSPGCLTLDPIEG